MEDVSERSQGGNSKRNSRLKGDGQWVSGTGRTRTRGG